MYVNSQNLNTATIAIVDDEDDNVFVLARMLQKAGYKNTFSTTDSRQALAFCTECNGDLILLDLHMPEPNVFQLMEQFAITRGSPAESHWPRRQGFLTKPIERIELLMRTRNLLESRYVFRSLLDQQRAAPALRARLKPKACGASFIESRRQSLCQRSTVSIPAANARAACVSWPPPSQPGSACVTTKVKRCRPRACSMPECPFCHWQVKSPPPTTNVGMDKATPGCAARDIPMAARIVSVVDYFDELTQPLESACRTRSGAR